MPRLIYGLLFLRKKKISPISWSYKKEISNIEGWILLHCDVLKASKKIIEWLGYGFVVEQGMLPPVMPNTLYEIAWSVWAFVIHMGTNNEAAGSWPVWLSTGQLRNEPADAWFCLFLSYFLSLCVFPLCNSDVQINKYLFFSNSELFKFCFLKK